MARKSKPGAVSGALIFFLGVYAFFGLDGVISVVAIFVGLVGLAVIIPLIFLVIRAPFARWRWYQQVREEKRLRALELADVDYRQRMSLDLAGFNQGVQDYWAEIGRRSAAVQDREKRFLELPKRYASRQSPHFTREELELIIQWKYTEARQRNRALDGLARVSDSRIIEVTSRIARVETPARAAAALEGAISGVGIAGISAILAAARPDRFPVIDVFALTAICHYYNPSWLGAVPRDADGRFTADMRSYTPYTDFCRQRAAELTRAANSPWTPRLVDMALWAIGKRLIDSRTVRPECVGHGRLIGQGLNALERFNGDLMTTEEIALSQAEQQIKARGHKVTRMPQNHRYGDLLARKFGRQVRVEVKGLASRNGVWLRKRQVEAVDIVVIYIVDENNVWILSPKEALALLDSYQSNFIARNGRPPAAEGFNADQFPAPTGWAPLDRLL